MGKQNKQTGEYVNIVWYAVPCATPKRTQVRIARYASKDVRNNGPRTDFEEPIEETVSPPSMEALLAQKGKKDRHNSTVTACYHGLSAMPRFSEVDDRGDPIWEDVLDDEKDPKPEKVNDASAVTME
jgi:hypothetical protein